MRIDRQIVRDIDTNVDRQTQMKQALRRSNSGGRGKLIFSKFGKDYRRGEFIFRKFIKDHRGGGAGQGESIFRKCSKDQRG